jgi:hypothetical protein
MPSVRSAVGWAAILLLGPVAASPAAVRMPHGRPDIRPLPAGTHPATPHAAGLLADSLGQMGVVDIDPVTRTPRNLGNLDGYLTGPSSADPSDVVLGYVRAHSDVFRLTSADIGGLQVVREYTDIAGLTHIQWRQWHDGLPVVDADLRADLTSDGRIIDIQGAPLADFGSVSLKPAIAARRAVQSASAGVRVTQSTSQLAYAPVRGGARLVYRVTGAAGANEEFVATVDARSGQTIERHNMVKWAAGDASVWNYYPSDQVGPNYQRTPVNFVTQGWLTAGTGTLDGPFAHVFEDANDDDTESAGDQIPSDTAGSSFTTFPGATCSTTYPCSWDPGTPNSWQANVDQNGAQAFYFINTFHDWLANPANNVGFNAAAGNFEGADAVNGETMDGANTSAGLPDANHLDNSNFLTMPVGQPSTMQMYLFEPVTGFNATDGNGGDEADVVYHEYTHGLSGRTITTSDGFEAVDGVQAGAMGEAWSDWYAMDYLVSNRIVTDTAAPDIRVGEYLTGGQGIRTEPMDCLTTDTAPPCNGGNSTAAGGYTYGDIGRIDSTGAPEVHSDGEIWAQTLWQLRTALGASETRQLVTEGMRLTPEYPSFLDGRNAIIEATHTLHPADLAKVWQVFTSRGMGYWSSTWGDDDTTPVQSFAAVPAANAPRVSVTGTAVDYLSGQPVSGAAIDFGGHETPGAAQTNLTTHTNSSGAYTIPHVPKHVYPQLFMDKLGYFGDEVTNLNVSANPTRVRQARMLRDWAMFDGGFFTGSDESNTLGCGPANAVDGLFGWGWVGKNALGHAPSLDIKLPATVDIWRIGIAPWVACYPLLDAASLGRAKLETSANGTSWHSLGQLFFTNADNASEDLFSIGTPSYRNGMRYVRITMEANQGGDPSFPGYVGMSELTVYALPVLSVKVSMKHAAHGKAKITLTCNEGCSTKVGHTTVKLAGAGTIKKTVKARGTVKLSIKGTLTGRIIKKKVKVK